MVHIIGTTDCRHVKQNIVYTCINICTCRYFCKGGLHWKEATRRKTLSICSDEKPNIRTSNQDAWDSIILLVMCWTWNTLLFSWSSALSSSQESISNWENCLDCLIRQRQTQMLYFDGSKVVWLTRRKSID